MSFPRQRCFLLVQQSFYFCWTLMKVWLQTLFGHHESVFPRANSCHLCGNYNHYPNRESTTEEKKKLQTSNVHKVQPFVPDTSPLVRSQRAELESGVINLTFSEKVEILGLDMWCIWKVNRRTRRVRRGIKKGMLPNWILNDVGLFIAVVVPTWTFQQTPSSAYSSTELQHLP